MVHNGIEYGDMQLICEAYHLLKSVIGVSPDEMADIFSEWNKTELDSYLIEITAQILRFKDEDGSNLVEKIRDTAGQVHVYPFLFFPFLLFSFLRNSLFDYFFSADFLTFILLSLHSSRFTLLPHSPPLHLLS